MSNKVLGIDLGTTYSAVARINEFDQAEVIENLEGDNTTPSVVYFEDADNFVVGKIAKNGQKVYPDDTISLIKRVMGERREFDFHGAKYTPESISALILRQLVEGAQEASGENTNRVVITVPAYFGLTEKEATKMAGEIAGLEIEGIIPEPIAAALSVGIKPGAPQNVFVYDLGGGTFDCTVMKLSDSGVDVLAVDGDRSLGGADWDQKMFDYVLERFVAQAQLEEDPSLDDEFYQDLLANVEDAKKSLTRKTKTKIRCSYGSFTEMVEITRDEFESITRDLVDQTLEVAKRTLAAAEAKEPGLRIDKYLLVGGSARMPMISEALESKLGWEVTPTEYDLAVAKGAAIYGQGAMDFVEKNGGSQAEEGEAKRFYLGGADSGEGMTITNLLSKSVGMRFVDPSDGMKPFVGFLLKQGDTLPASNTIDAQCAQDGTTRLPVQIYEQTGEVPSKEMEANTEITPEGGAAFSDLPNLPKGSPIKITMSVSAEGLLTLEGFEPETKQDLKLEVRVATLQEEEVARATEQIQGMIRSE